MSKKVEILRSLVEQRLTAAVEEIFGLVERTIVEYEDELCRTKEENQRQKQILDSVLNSQVMGEHPDVDHLPVFKEDIPSEQEEDRTSPRVDPNPETPLIKEEQEEMRINDTGQLIPLSELVSTAASPESHPSGVDSPQSQNTLMFLDPESPSGKRQRMNAEALQMPWKTEKERSQAYRDRIKEDPVKYEERKKRDRERYQRKKERGVVKPIGELPKREQRNKRRQRRTYMKKYRENIKNAVEVQAYLATTTPPNTPESVPPEPVPPPPTPPLPLPSAQPVTQKQRGRKKVMRNRSKGYAALYESNAKLEKVPTHGYNRPHP